MVTFTKTKLLIRGLLNPIKKYWGHSGNFSSILLSFPSKQEIDLNDLSSAALPKIPMGVSLRAHWLAIDGVQPSIPENPPAQSKEQLTQESANPLSKLKNPDAKENKLSHVLHSKPSKLRNMETVKRNIYLTVLFSRK